MKKRCLLIVAVLALAMLAMGACSRVTLAVTDSTEKSMSIEANRSDPGDFMMGGGLEVAEGEQVVMSGNMEKGELRIELYGVPEEQSADELPDIEGGEPVMTFNANGTSSISGTLEAGSYMIKVTTAEKATGTVQIDVTPANN